MHAIIRAGDAGCCCAHLFEKEKTLEADIEHLFFLSSILVPHTVHESFSTKRTAI